MPGRVLLIDRDSDATLVRGLRGDGHELLEAPDRASLARLLETGVVDVCLLDFDFPEAREVSSQVRARFPGVPLMMLVGSGLHAMLDAVELGATDVLTKPLGNTPMVSRLIFWAVEREQLRRTNEELRRVLGAKADRPPAAIEASLAELGRSVTHVAHEIRNPLTALSAKLQLLRRKAAHVAPVTELSSSLIDEVSRLSRFLSELLEYGRAQKPVALPTDLAATLAEVVSLYREECENNHLTLTVRLPNHCPRVHCAPEHLHQVFQNLLVNAIDATPPDGEIGISVTQADPRDLTVEFRNPGHLGDDTLERMFDLFFTTKAHGTGMGLALVRRLTQENGGAVSACNDGAAVVVKVTLPISTAP